MRMKVAFVHIHYGVCINARNTMLAFNETVYLIRKTGIIIALAIFKLVS